MPLSNQTTFRTMLLLALTGCGDPGSTDPGSAGGRTSNGGSGGAGGVSSGGSNPSNGGSFSSGGVATSNGGISGGGSFSSGGFSNGGSLNGGSFNGGSTNGGTSTSNGGTLALGGTTAAGGKASGGSSTTQGGATASGGAAAAGGKTSGGATGSGGASSTGYACNGTTTGYDVTVIKNGSTWTITRNGSVVGTNSDMSAAMTAGWKSLTANRTTKQSMLVQGSGDIPATSQIALPSYLILNVCGTINVSGTPSGSDKSPIYARGQRDIDIPNLKMTGSPQYGMFFRLSDNIHLGNIELSLTSTAGVGIRVDNHPSNGTTALNQNFTLDSVKGTGMGSHIVETYGINNVKIGSVTGTSVGECGLLLNRTTNAEVDLVSCTDCGKGTNYAAFRIANDAGKIGSDWPAGNIHVKKVYARGGGTGIFSVSGSGGLTIDSIDIANTGATAILLQNCYNTTIATQSGTVSGNIPDGAIRLSNDMKDTPGTFAPSKNIAIKNLTLSNGARLLQDYCDYGRNGSSVTNVTGGTVTLCP